MMIVRDLGLWSFILLLVAVGIAAVIAFGVCCG
jgi:hypothetical protein